MRTLLVAASALVLLPAGGHAQSSALTLATSTPSVVFGERVVLRGTVTPAQANVRVLLERGGVTLARATTDERGRFTASIRPARHGTWRARVAGAAVRSAPLSVYVWPRLTVEVRDAYAYAGAKVVVRAKPPTNAPILLVVMRKGETTAELTTKAGRPTLVPLDGVGRFVLRARVEDSIATAPVVAATRTLSLGSTGEDVRALRARLRELRIHVGGSPATFDHTLFDSVVAFQKSRGLARTGVVDAHTWRALAQDTVPAPRYRTRGEHIEVSKSRQIMLVVRDGETVAILPVSSGRTGNTPVGAFSIKWKALATTTWLGPAILYRTMTFHGNFAIHGYGSVPSYPASSGCVRIPIWVADWLYRRSHVGERVYVYE